LCNRHTSQLQRLCLLWSHPYSRLALLSYGSEDRLSNHISEQTWLWKIYHKHISISPISIRMMDFLSIFQVMRACLEPSDLGLHCSLQSVCKFVFWPPLPTAELFSFSSLERGRRRMWSVEIVLKQRTRRNWNRVLRGSGA
jgi:hypothetical protein